MAQRHRCWVCNSQGFIAEGAVFVRPDAPPQIRLVAQCPRCRRWFCAEHAEPLNPTGIRGFLRRFGEPEAVKVGCPFDPGIALGEPCDD